MNIKDIELKTLMDAAYETSGCDISKAARSIETIDLMLGVIKNKTLINARERNAKSRFTRGRGLRTILEQIILRP